FALGGVDMASMRQRFLTGQVSTFLRSKANPESTESNTQADDEGFTLAEVIVSIALFTVISFSVMLALITLVKYTGVTQNRVAAANIARQEVERLRGENSTLSLLDL